LVATLLKPRGDHQKRISYQSTSKELNDHHQSTETSIAIRVGVERLELIMRHCRPHDGRQLRRIVDPPKEHFNPSSKLVAGRRGNKARVIQTAPRCADDHDAIAKTASIA